LINDDLTEKINFAHRRFQDLLVLIRNNTLGIELRERQQLVQEFFFHLIGAIDLLAQLVNERRGLGLDTESVTVTAVRLLLPSTDNLSTALQSLYVKTRGEPLPADPYNDDGYLFRAYNYRNQVTHRRRNPFTFRVGSLPSVSFLLDPRTPKAGNSTRSVEEDMQNMLGLVTRRCTDALALF
jgi:hypothetical protein